MPVSSPLPIASKYRDAPQALCEAFRHARPFRHLKLDEFLDPAFADQLLAQFPPFERGNARNEQGELGGKSVVEQIRSLGTAFAKLDDLVRSSEFLGWLSEATGIPQLLYDPDYFGGGTHENRHGQDLDPHIDFNRHPGTGWHRRLNLIIYLNPVWEDAWGGSLELHSDPRSDSNEICLLTPLFNRCVVFETTESSWHGFSRIHLPEESAGLSRRSIALYFYTRTRPAEETGPTHSTIYVDRPLPDHLVPGHVLDESDVHALKVLLARRDQHNQRLYRELIRAESALQDRKPAVMFGGLRSVLRASVGLARFGLSSRDAEAREALKKSCQPLVHRLPAAIREPLRRTWRRSSTGG